MKLTLKKRVKDYLVEEPRARERKNRAKAIWHMLEKLHPEFDMISKDFFEKEIWTELQSINRLITKLQQEFAHLRGYDYDEKSIYEQQAQIDLGYEPGYHRDTKTNKLL